MFVGNSTYVAKLYVARRKGIRQMFNLDYRTHTYIVFGLTCNIELRLHRKLA